MKKLLILMTLAALPLAACGGGGSETDGGTTGGGDSAAIAAGKQAFIDRTCATCHGEGGQGDGVVSATLDPKPRNYTEASWQDAVSDEDIKSVINKGGEANGLSVTIAAYPDIQGEELDNIVAYIRSLKK